MLTGKPPKDGKKELRKQHSKDIEHSLQKSVWEPQDKDVSRLLNLSESCIDSIQVDKHDINSSHIVNEMEVVCNAEEKYIDQVEETGKCTLCLVNNAVSGINRIKPKCNKNINICVSCMRNSSLSPIRCPHCSEGTIYPKIGHTFAALLIAGNDTKEKALAKSLKREILDIHDVLVSKWPCVIGIREEHVKVIAPSTPGDDEELLTLFDTAVDDLKRKLGLETLIVYFTGHHDEKGLRLGKAREHLSFEWLQRAIKEICKTWKNNETRVLAFLDCCNPPPIRNVLTDTEIKLIQINVCSEHKQSRQPESGSLFKTYFIQALTRKSFNKKCHDMPTNEECCLCPISGDFVSVHSLHSYIAEHMERKEPNFQQPLKFENGIEAKDAIIAYNIDFSIAPTVWFENESGETKKISVFSNIYPNIEILKNNVIEKIKEQANARQKEITFIHEKLPDVLCIRIHNGQNDGKELKSMLDLSSAMIGKREIVVSYRKVEGICKGKAVRIQPGNFLIKLMDDSKMGIEVIKEKIMAVRVFKDISVLDGFITHLNTKTHEKNETETQENDNVEEILECFKEITSIWRDEMKKNGTSRKLKVCFPHNLDLIVFELADS